MGTRHVLPRSRQQDERLIEREQSNFSMGMMSDPDITEVGELGMSYLENVVPHIDRLEGRTGTALFGSDITSSMVPFTGFTAIGISVAYGVLHADLGIFSENNVGGTIMLESPVRTTYRIDEFVDFSNIKVSGTTEDVVAEFDTDVKMFDKMNGSFQFHDKNLFFIHMGTKLYCKDSSDIDSEYKQIPVSGTGAIENLESRFFSAFGCAFCSCNGSIFRIEGDSCGHLSYFKTNEPMDALSTAGTAIGAFVDYPDSFAHGTPSSSNFVYRYAIRKTRLSGKSLNGRLTIGSTIELESESNLVSEKDYTQANSWYPIGTAMDDLQIYTSHSTTLTAAQKDIQAIKALVDPAFKITYRSASYECYPIFTYIETLYDFATEITRAIASHVPGITFGYSTKETGVYFVKSDSSVSFSAPSTAGKSDISYAINNEYAKATYGISMAATSFSGKNEQFTHTALYRTKDIGNAISLYDPKKENISTPTEEYSLIGEVPNTVALRVKFSNPSTGVYTVALSDTSMILPDYMQYKTMNIGLLYSDVPMTIPVHANLSGAWSCSILFKKTEGVFYVSFPGTVPSMDTEYIIGTSSKRKTSGHCTVSSDGYSITINNDDLGVTDYSGCPIFFENGECFRLTELTNAGVGAQTYSLSGESSAKNLDIITAIKYDGGSELPFLDTVSDDILDSYSLVYPLENRSITNLPIEDGGSSSCIGATTFFWSRESSGYKYSVPRYRYSVGKYFPQYQFSSATSSPVVEMIQCKTGVLGICQDSSFLISIDQAVVNQDSVTLDTYTLLPDFYVADSRFGISTRNSACQLSDYSILAISTGKSVAVFDGTTWSESVATGTVQKTYVNALPSDLVVRYCNNGNIYIWNNEFDSYSKICLCYPTKEINGKGWYLVSGDGWPFPETSSQCCVQTYKDDTFDTIYDRGIGCFVVVDTRLSEVDSYAQEHMYLVAWADRSGTGEEVEIFTSATTRGYTGEKQHYDIEANECYLHTCNPCGETVKDAGVTTVKFYTNKDSYKIDTIIDNIDNKEIVSRKKIAGRYFSITLNTEKSKYAVKRVELYAKINDKGRASINDSLGNDQYAREEELAGLSNWFSPGRYETDRITGNVVIGSDLIVPIDGPDGETGSGFIVDVGNRYEFANSLYHDGMILFWSKTTPSGWKENIVNAGFDPVGGWTLYTTTGSVIGNSWATEGSYYDIRVYPAILGENTISDYYNDIVNHGGISYIPRF